MSFSRFRHHQQKWNFLVSVVDLIAANANDLHTWGQMDAALGRRVFTAQRRRVYPILFLLPPYLYRLQYAENATALERAYDWCRPT